MARKKLAQPTHPHHTRLDAETWDVLRHLVASHSDLSGPQAAVRHCVLGYSQARKARRDAEDRLKEAQAQVGDVERYLREQGIAEGQPIDAAVAALANLKEATEVSARAAQENYAEACQHRDRAEKERDAATARVEELVADNRRLIADRDAWKSDAESWQSNYHGAVSRGRSIAASKAAITEERDAARSDLADLERQRNEARGERTAATLERDRVRRERDKVLDELADRDLGIGRAGWWVIGIACGTAATLLATWLASGGLG